MTVGSGNTLKYLPSVLLLAFLFSPRLLGPVRLGDILVAAAMVWYFPSWMSARMRSDRLNVLEKGYCVLLIMVSLSAIFSLATGMNGRGAACALTIGRLMELAALYFITTQCPGALGSLRKSSMMAILVLGIWAIVEMISMQLFTITEYHRVFNEGMFAGEANHVAGALVLLSILATAPAGSSASPALGSFLSILLSGSRAAFAAAAVSHARIFIVMRRYRELVLLAAAAVALLVYAPSGTIHRWMDVFREHPAYSGPHVDRLESWAAVIRETPVWCGAGPGSRPSSVYESCYMLLYAEVGIAGLAAFLFLLAAMIFTRVPGPRADHVAPALGAALAVLSLAANTLIIARIGATAAIILGAVRTPSRT